MLWLADYVTEAYVLKSKKKTNQILNNNNGRNECAIMHFINTKIIRVKWPRYCATAYVDTLLYFASFSVIILLIHG